MKHIFHKSAVLKTNLSKASARSFASEPALHCSDGADKNGTLGQRWQEHENEVLIAGIEKQQLEHERLGGWNAEQSSKQKWEEIESFCHSKGISRTAEQCRDRWKRLLHAFFKIKSWQNCKPPGKTSFWLMKASEKKVEGLSFNLDWKTFNAIDVIQSRKELWFSTAGFSSAEGVSSESPSSNVKSLEPETNDLKREQCREAQQQSETDDFEEQECTAVQQLETDHPQQCTKETTNSISSDLDMHSSQDKCSADLSGSTLQTQNSHNDDRPPVLVQFINQCLVDLKGLEYDPCDPFKGQIDEGKGIKNESRGSSGD